MCGRSLDGDQVSGGRCAGNVENSRRASCARRTSAAGDARTSAATSRRRSGCRSRSGPLGPDRPVCGLFARGDDRSRRSRHPTNPCRRRSGPGIRLGDLHSDPDHLVRTVQGHRRLPDEPRGRRPGRKVLPRAMADRLQRPTARRALLRPDRLVDGAGHRVLDGRLGRTHAVAAPRGGTRSARAHRADEPAERRAHRRRPGAEPVPAERRRPPAERRAAPGRRHPGDGQGRRSGARRGTRRPPRACTW